MTETILSVRNPEEALYFLKRELVRRNGVKWTMKDGTTINIREMSDAHLLRTIEMLMRLKDEYEIISAGID